MSTLATEGPVSGNFARRMFARGTDCLGPEEVEQTFGQGVIPNTTAIPQIPFSEEELRRARALGQCLELHGPFSMRWMHGRLGNKLGNGKLLYNTDWYNESPFYTTKAAADWHWRLTTKGVITGSTSQNYLGQTRAIATYLRERVYAGQELPGAYATAIAEFEQREKCLADLMSQDWKKVAEELANLQLSQLCRETPAQVLWSIALYKAINGEYLLPNVWTWTKSRSTRGSIVSVGLAAPDGVCVYHVDPGYSHGRLGVRFSRSVLAA